MDMAEDPLMTATRMNRAGALLLLLVTMTACSGLPGTGGSSPTTMTDGAWVLTDLGGGAVGDMAEHLPTLSFGADGMVSGSDGCNRLRGGYTTDGQMLSFEAMASTRMACTHGEALAQAFGAALSITQSYRLDGDALTLFDGTGEPIMRFEQEER
jgi:heat shock protein HslJ